MVDVGLTAGVKSLWRKASLRDYTLKVEDQEFQVHKVVLAAVSDFFQAMLCDSYVESNSDRVELKGLCASAVSILLEFVYTGDELLLSEADDALEVLKCAMYLQMPAVCEFCVKKLSGNLSYENCLEILAVCMEYSFHKEVTEVKQFIKLNWKEVFELCNPVELSAKQLQVLIENWQKSEWDMFLFVNSWFSSDPETNKDGVNDLLTEVRFSIIPPKKVESVRDMEIFSNTEGSWHDLVEKALEYHQMPMHMKVFEKSEQSTLRAGPSPVIFSTHDSENQPNKSEDKIKFYVLDKENKWRKHEIVGTNAPKYKCSCVCTTVNGFLIVGCYDENQVWLMFDPRTMTWSPMPTLPRPTMHFTLVHDEEYLYVIGGKNLPEENPADAVEWGSGTPTDAVEQYSFRTNTWTTFTRLPVMLSNLPGACVVGDKLYVSGGRIENEGGDGVFYCLDLSPECPEWVQKAKPDGWSKRQHQLCAMKIENENVVLMIHVSLTMGYYSPSKDQWVYLDFQYLVDRIEPSSLEYCTNITHGNTLYILNLQHMVEEYDVPHPKIKHHHNFYVVGKCWKGVIPEPEISDDQIEHFPYNYNYENRNDDGDWDFSSCVMAVPCEMYY